MRRASRSALTRPPASVTELLRITGITEPRRADAEPRRFLSRGAVPRADRHRARPRPRCAGPGACRAPSGDHRAPLGAGRRDGHTPDLRARDQRRDPSGHEHRRRGRAPDHRCSSTASGSRSPILAPASTRPACRRHDPASRADTACSSSTGCLVAGARHGGRAGDARRVLRLVRARRRPREEAGDQAAQFSTPSRSQQYSSRHSLASSTQRASESQGSTVSNA